MRKLLILLGIVLLATSCSDRTEFGECVGLITPKDPTLVYDIRGGNVFWGIIGAEMVLPPIYVGLKNFYCPIAKK